MLVKMPAELAGETGYVRHPENKNADSPVDHYSDSPAPTPIADTAPKFDIARVCQSEGGSNEEQKRCADDETQARDTLQTE
jgi:hypothetical protein